MAAQSFEFDMEDPKAPMTNGTTSTSTTTLSSPVASTGNNSNESNHSDSRNTTSSLDASLLSPTSSNATVRTRRNNNSSMSSGSAGGSSSGTKSSVFQLVKSKANTSSSLVTSSVASNSNNSVGTAGNLTSNNGHTNNNNGFESINNGSGFQANESDLEKTLPKIDLNRNMDLFGQSNATNSNGSGMVNRKEHVDDSPIIKQSFEGKTKFSNSRFGRFIRRIVNHFRVWAKSPAIKYTVIVLLVLSLIALLGMYVLPMLKSSSGAVDVPPIITSDGKTTEVTTPQKEEASSGPSLWQRIIGVFSRRSESDLSTGASQTGAPADLVLSLLPEKYKENFESYLTLSKPIVLKKYGSKWIASSTWKKEFTSNNEFVKRLNKMKKQLAKYVKRKGVSITLANLDKLPSSVHRVPFTTSVKENEFEYDFPTSLDQFSTLRTLFSEIWFANFKKDQPTTTTTRIGRKENPNKIAVCMIADTYQYSQLVQLTSPNGEDIETEIKTNDCIYIPSGWGFNFIVKASTKFVTWIYE